MPPAKAMILRTYRRKVVPKRYLFVMLLFFCAGPTKTLVANEAQEKKAANLEIAAGLITESALQRLERHLPSGSPLQIDVGPATDIGNWTGQILTDSCLEANYLVYSSAKDSSKMVRLRIKNPEIGIEYNGIRRLFPGRQKLKRRISCRYHLAIVEPDGQIVLSEFIEKQFADTIKSDQLPRVEHKSYSFSKGTKSGKSIIKRWVEPVILITTTTTVVYLFFSLRSEN